MCTPLMVKNQIDAMGTEGVERYKNAIRDEIIRKELGALTKAELVQLYGYCRSRLSADLSDYRASESKLTPRTESVAAEENIQFDIEL